MSKKFFSVLLFILVMASIYILSFNSFANSIGDINNDSRITTTDAAHIDRYIIGTVKFDIATALSADVNNDGKISSTDSALITRYTLGLIKQFPASIIPTTSIETTPTPTESIPNIITNAGENKITYKNFNVILSGELSKIPENISVNYSWRIIEQPKDSTSKLATPNLVKTNFTPDLVGDYTLGLTITYKDNIYTESTVKISVKELNDSTDSIDFSNYSKQTIGNSKYDYNDLISLSSGWMIVKDPTQNKVLFYNPFTNEIGKEIEFDSLPDNLELDFDKNILYVSFKYLNKIAKYSINSNTITYLDIEKPAIKIKYGEQNILFATLPGAHSFTSNLKAIDTSSNSILSTIDFSSLYFIEYDPNKNNIFLAETSTSPSSLARFSFNETTFELKNEQEIWDMGGNGLDLSISPDGKHVAFCAGGGNGSGYTIFDVNSSDISTLYGEWNTGAYPTSSDFSLDNSYFIAYNGSSLQLFNIKYHTLLNTVPISSKSYSKVKFSRGQKIVYSYSDNFLSWYKSGI